jgi:hypothetical protein
VGNRILEARWAAIDLWDLGPGAADILVANNTLLRNLTALRIWDDHSKGQDFLNCRNIRFQNNLILATQFPADLRIVDHGRGKPHSEEFPHKPGDVEALLRSPQWRFSHNWREVDPVTAATPRLDHSWIPACPNDHLQDPIEVGPRKLGDPHFLRPPKDSPLARAGAGGDAVSPASLVSAVGEAGSAAHPWMAAWAVTHIRNQPDPALPAYVGAVAPEGVQPWNWDITWKRLAR